MSAPTSRADHMTSTSRALARAIEHLGAVAVASEQDVYAYQETSTGPYFAVRTRELTRLPEYLDSAGGYAKWFADVRPDEMLIWWTPSGRVRIVDCPHTKSTTRTQCWSGCVSPATCQSEAAHGNIEEIETCERCSATRSSEVNQNHVTIGRWVERQEEETT
jgi:hypothetical protein